MVNLNNVESIIFSRMAILFLLFFLVGHGWATAVFMNLLMIYLCVEGCFILCGFGDSVTSFVLNTKNIYFTVFKL